MAPTRSMLLANILPLAAVQALIIPKQDLFCQLDSFGIIPQLTNFEPAQEFCSSKFPAATTTETVTPITDGFTTKTHTVTVFSSLVDPTLTIDPVTATITPIAKVAKRGALNPDFFGGRSPDYGRRPHWPDFDPRPHHNGGGYTNNNQGYGSGGSPYGDDGDDGDDYDDGTGEGDTPDGTWYPAPPPETISVDVSDTFISLPTSLPTITVADPTITLPTISDPTATLSSLIGSLTSDLGPIASDLTSDLPSLISSLSSDLPAVTSALSSLADALTSDIPTITLPTVTPFTTHVPIPVSTGAAAAFASLQSLDAAFQSSVCSCIEDASTVTVTGRPTATGHFTVVETVTVTKHHHRGGY